MANEVQFVPWVLQDHGAYRYWELPVRTHRRSLAIVSLLVGMAGCGPVFQSTKSDRAPLEVVGKTQPVQGRRCIIAPVPLHPVVEVLVKPGDRVKKGQALVKLDDDEAQADVRAKRAALGSAEILLKEARRHQGASEKAHSAGALAEATYCVACVTAMKAEQEHAAAKAALEAAEAELEHFTVESYINGVVAWLDVHPGMVSRPGTTVWGEVLDLSELDVRCELPPEQVERLAMDQIAEVRAAGRNEVLATGKVTYIGIAADKNSGLITVMVRVPNPKLGLRGNVPVQVRFTETVAGK